MTRKSCFPSFGGRRLDLSHRSEIHEKILSVHKEAIRWIRAYSIGCRHSKGLDIILESLFCTLPDHKWLESSSEQIDKCVNLGARNSSYRGTERNTSGQRHLQGGLKQ